MKKLHLRTARLASIGALLMAGPAAAQYQIQGGNALDSNLQLGSGGLNRPVYGGAYGSGQLNRIMSGTAAGGQSFRGFSPIGDPNSIFSIGQTSRSISGSGLLRSYSGLPSDRLSDFSRDSIGAQDVRMYAPGGGLPNTTLRPYYSQSSGIADVGAILAQGNRPGSSQLISTYQDPQGLPLAGGPTLYKDLETKSRGGTLLQVPTRIVRADTGQPLTGSVNPLLRQSSLFGGQFREVDTNTLAAQTARGRALDPGIGSPLDTRVNAGEPLDTRVNSQVDMRRGGGLADTDSALNRDIESRRADQPVVPLDRPIDAESTEEPPALRSTTGRELVRPTRTATSGRTGGLARPLGSGAGQPAGDVPGASQAGPSAVGGRPAPFRLPQASGTTITTLVGQDDTLLNRHLAEAETLLKSGEYYKAADRYSLARGLDLRNPLPLLGRSMALLAAGEYMSSAGSLFQAIRDFESLPAYPVDLTAFIPDLAVLDRRRADLEQRLAARELFRLRFLLGFAEYSSGLQKLGIANMEKAAADAPEDMDMLRKFVSTLKSRDPAMAEPINNTPAGAK